MQIIRVANAEEGGKKAFELIKEGINKKDAIKASSVILKINKNYIKKLFID